MIRPLVRAALLAPGLAEAQDWSDDRASVDAFGGLGLGSDLSWEAFAGVSNAFSDRIRGEPGSRYFSIDYDDNGVAVDLQLHGPTVGLSLVY